MAFRWRRQASPGVTDATDGKVPERAAAANRSGTSSASTSDQRS